MSEATAGREFSKEEVRMFLSDLGEKVRESGSGQLHVLVSLNQLMSAPNATALFSDDLKAQAREIWLKLKASGVQLSDPPLLFGYPEVKSAAEAAAEEHDGTDSLVIDMTRFREEERKEEEKRKKMKAADKKRYRDDELDEDEEDGETEFEDDDSGPEPEEER